MQVSEKFLDSIYEEFPEFQKVELEDITDEMESIKRKVAVEAKTYLNKPIQDDRFERGTTMSDILARYSQVTARKS